MLTRLSIRNIVLIEACDIALKDGLCVLSGETGAGKSILLDALGLVLGARADSTLVRSNEAQGSVSAEFDISDNAGAKALLRELELEPSDTLILRRTLASDGKTRCLVNDAPVTVAALKKLGEALVEVHGQHDQKSLQDAALHRALLDEYGVLVKERRAVAESYRTWKQAREASSALQEEIARAAREQDYLRHMRSELKELGPQSGEEETLTQQRATMMGSEKLFSVLNEAIATLNHGNGVLGALRSAQRTLTRSPLTAPYGPVIEGLERAAIEAEEALYVLEKAGQDATFSPEKLERTEERLFALKAAGRKYNMPVDELAALYHDVEEKLSLIDSQEHRLAGLKKQEAQARQSFVTLAQALSGGRKKAAGKLEKAVERELRPLMMDGTRFRVRVEAQEEGGWSESGSDAVAFECATNVGKGAVDVAYAPLNKIASGGELSRFMLAMKVALSSVRQATTLIFDEIDTGTGGAVAAAIGERLSLLGGSAQVLVVTHLPQVAARGGQHLLVSKKATAKKIVTTVEELSPDARQEELARMLAGAVITPEARKAALKLLEPAA